MRFLPYQKRERLPLSLSSADVHVVGLAKGLAGYVVPSRLYGILSAGRPVIARPGHERDCAARARDRLRHRDPARAPRAARAHDREAADGASTRGDGTARARVRRGGGGSARRHGALPRPRARDPRRVIARVCSGVRSMPSRGRTPGIRCDGRARAASAEAGAQGRHTPSVSLVVSAHDEEAVIRRRIENLLALDYRRTRSIVVASDGSTDLTDAIVAEIAAETARAPPPVPPQGQGRRAASRGARNVERRRRVHGREHRVEGRRVARAHAEPRGAGGRLRLRAAPAREPDGANMEGTYWRYEMWVRAQESVQLDHGGQRRDLRGRSGRHTSRTTRSSATTSVPVPHGAGGPARRVRAGGGRRREAGGGAGGRVRAKGADDLARARPHPHGRTSVRRGRSTRRARLAPRAAVLDRAPPVGLLVSNVALLARAPFYRLFLVLQLARPRTRGGRERGSRFRARGSRTTTTS